MGMFDYIRCDYPLPDEPPTRTFQTKSLGRDMALYVITEGGRLVQKNPGIFGDHWDGESPDYRGEIEFYTNGPDREWWEYSALFDEGKVINIKRVGETGR